MAEPGPSKAAGDVIMIEDDPNNFLEAGPQNPAEACAYMDKLDMIFINMDDLLTDNRKDNFKSQWLHLRKPWPSIGIRWQKQMLTWS